MVSHTNIMSHGAVGNGTTDDTAAFNAAVAALNANGGTITFDALRYKGKFAVSANKRIELIGYGATLVPKNNEPALVLNQGSGSGIQGIQAKGFHIQGDVGATNVVGVRVQNSDRACLEDIKIEDCLVGIQLVSSDALWTEGTRMTSVFVDNCSLAGVTFEKWGTGTGSFAETTMYDLMINNCSTAMHVQPGTTLYRCLIAPATIWLNDNQTGLYLEGLVKGSALYMNFESFGTPTNLTGIHVLATAQNVADADWICNFVGNFTNKVFVAPGQTLVYREGSNYYVNGESTPRMNIQADGIYLDGTWNGAHLQLGTTHFWTDPLKKLRIKEGAPVSAYDGKVVATSTTRTIS